MYGPQCCFDFACEKEVEEAACEKEVEEAALALAFAAAGVVALASSPRGGDLNLRS